MNAVRFVVCVLILAVGLPAQAADCESVLGKYMVGQALLAANYVAAAEKAGRKPAEINAALKDIAARSAIEEFWITDSNGRVREVRGAGVVGEQPVLQPGTAFEYTSGAPLETPSGFMTGSYQMRASSGENFEIDIPLFALESPYEERRIH